MSQEPRLGPLSDDATHSSSDDRSVIDKESGISSSRHSARRPPLRARPQSWHPYGPVEPPLEPASSRPIGVHAILNPPAQVAGDSSGTSGNREPLTLPGPASSPRPRQGSSPIPRAVPPIAQQPLSPRSHSRPVMNTSSPSARFVSGSGRASGQSSVVHSPLIHHDPSLGSRQPLPVSSPIPLDSTLRPVASLPPTQPPSLASLHSTASIHSRRTSAGPGPLTTPNSQETSPTTPHSSFSHFGRASPAVTNVSLPPTTAPYAAQMPYVTIESMSRAASVTAGPRSSVSEEIAGMPGLIPCVLDLKSGSSSQAEKRKANSDASRRFRNRKRNEMQLEQRLSAQQDELQRQTDEIRALIQQRDHYRTERDFFREHLDRAGSLTQLPPRPPSPRSSLVPAADSGAAAWASGGTGPDRPPAMGSLHPARGLASPRAGCWTRHARKPVGLVARPHTRPLHPQDAVSDRHRSQALPCLASKDLGPGRDWGGTIIW